MVVAQLEHIQQEEQAVLAPLAPPAVGVLAGLLQSVHLETTAPQVLHLKHYVLKVHIVAQMLLPKHCAALEHIVPQEELYVPNARQVHTV